MTFSLKLNITQKIASTHFTMNEWCKFTDKIHKVDRGESRNGKIANLPAATLKPVQLLFIPLLWSPDMKNWLNGKDPDAGKDWRQEEKGTTEDEMVGWYHWLSGHEFWVNSGSWWGTGRPGVLGPWGHKELDTTEQLNWTELIFQIRIKNIYVSSIYDYMLLLFSC